MRKLIVCSLMSCLFSQIDYETEIQTIFNNNCIDCHGNSGGLSLESYANLMAGGNSGTVIISGNHSNSLLWQKINNGEMPPSGELSSSDIDLIASWIDEGALEELNTYNNNELPRLFTLNQNYPNPFNSKTMLHYELSKKVHINIIIYDMLGRRVKTLVNSSQSAGYKSIQWNATNDKNHLVSAGLYMYTIEAGQFRQTKKMVFLK